MKQRQAVLRDQKLQASSMENSTPPMGAPKAAEIPADTPADTNSRWSESLTISSRILSFSFRLNSFRRPKHEVKILNTSPSMHSACVYGWRLHE